MSPRGDRGVTSCRAGIVVKGASIILLTGALRPPSSSLRRARVASLRSVGRLLVAAERRARAITLLTTRATPSFLPSSSSARARYAFVSFFFVFSRALDAFVRALSTPWFVPSSPSARARRLRFVLLRFVRALSTPSFLPSSPSACSRGTTYLLFIRSPKYTEMMLNVVGLTFIAEVPSSDRSLDISLGSNHGTPRRDTRAGRGAQRRSARSEMMFVVVPPHPARRGAKHATTTHTARDTPKPRFGAWGFGHLVDSRARAHVEQGDHQPLA